MEFSRDIIEELLVRLPVKTIMKFKSVSKDWNGLISDISFRRRYESQQLSKGNAPTGFICHDHIIDKMDKLFYYRAFYDRGNEFLYTSKHYIEKEELKNLKYLDKIGFVMAASKGLLLLRSSKTLSVFDLVSKNYFQLPENYDLRNFMSFGFNCQEKSIKDGNYDHHRLCYKVVCVPLEEEQAFRQSYNVEIYLSETGTWAKKIMQANSSFPMRPYYQAKVIGGAFHWYAPLFNHIIAYDSEDPQGHTILIECPCEKFPRSERYGYMTFEGTKDGSLLLIRMEEMTIDVWIMDMKNGQSYMNEDKVYATMWNLAYKVSPGDICGGISCFPYPSRIIAVDPVDHHTVYVKIDNQIYAYNYYEKIVLFASSQKLNPHARVFVPFKWPTFPCL